MERAILTSIQPQHTCNIFNGIKLWEIRKKFPRDYVGWVYIYCTKRKPYLKEGNIKPMHDLNPYNPFNYSWYLDDDNYRALNGKVVARFWCDKVEPVYKFYVEELCQLACINKEELYKYAGGWYNTDDLLAIHITKLEIFDKPKEISEFFTHKMLGCEGCCEYCDNQKCRLTRAPQSWCYIEI